MPILLVFALAATCMPVRWPAPIIGGSEKTAIGFSAGVVGLSVLVAVALRIWVVRTMRRSPIRKAEVASVYTRIRRLMFFVNLGLVAVCILVFGWGWYVQETFVITDELDPDGPRLLMPFAELLVPLPYFLLLFTAWTVYYDAERILHQTSVTGPINRPYWGRIGFFFQHLRQFSLLVMLPIMLFVTQQTISRFAPEAAQTDWFRVASIAVVPVLILFMPLVMKPLLGLKTMPAGPERTRLEALAKRLHFRCTDFLLWPTHGAAANAMIVGLLPWVRYVVFTDRILEELAPDELDAVFGHEVGHAKHGHIWLYALFLGLSMTVLAALLLLIGQQLDAAGVFRSKTPEDIRLVQLVSVGFIASYVFLVFGYLSRRCERQADVFGCRAVSCGDPACTGHDEKTLYPEGGRGLCPTGIRTFVRALERVGEVNDHGPIEAEKSRSLGAVLRNLFAWLRAWQHSTMSRRVDFLLSLIGNPEKERRFQRGVWLLRCGLILSLAAALYGLGTVVEWHELWKAM